MRARSKIVVGLATAASLAVVAAPVVSVGAQPTAGAAKKKPKKAKVRDDYFSPTELTIKSGQKVKWSWGNTNFNSHDVTLKSGPKGVKKFRSNTAAIGYSYTKKFKKKGKYQIYCTIHPSVMNMTVKVKKKK